MEANIPKGTDSSISMPMVGIWNETKRKKKIPRQKSGDLFSLMRTPEEVNELADLRDTD